jgi:hypothetical protein
MERWAKTVNAAKSHHQPPTEVVKKPVLNEEPEFKKVFMSYQFVAVFVRFESFLTIPNKPLLANSLLKAYDK